jgi:shikimate dehydrogenase
MTKYIDLIGYPLKHSISPIFQQAALNYCKIDACYLAHEIQPAELNQAIDQLRMPHCLGANITVPYKEKAISLVDQIDEQSKIYGAINTIVNEEGVLIGYNTDATGFLKGLNCVSGFKLEGKRAVILGAGGVARAASFVLLKNGVLSLHIVNRTVERAQNLVNSLTTYAKVNLLPVKVEYLSPGISDFKRTILESCLIVNCTTMGMKYSPNPFMSPLEKQLISSDALIYDLVYNPLQTPLLKLAEEVGARTLSGLPMLIYQGSAAFELWTQNTAPIDIMFETAKDQLTGL